MGEYIHLLALTLALVCHVSPARESTFGKMSYLQPMDTRQYLYCLKPKPEYAEKAGVIKGVTVIGKLDIVWKTNLGERGRLQTSQLQRMVSGFCLDVEVQLKSYNLTF